MSEPEAKKQKLTLSVDKEVVDRAKELGLNLSEITENVLRGFAFSPKDESKAEVYAKYKELFATVQPLLKDYDASIEVARDTQLDDTGNVVMETSILLTPVGTFWAQEEESGFSEIEKIPLYAFHQPNKILANLITRLTNEKQDRRDRLRELEMAKRIVLAMSESLHSNPKDTLRVTLGRRKSRK